MGIWTMALPGGYPVTALIVALVAGVNARAGFAVAGITMIAITAVTWTSLGRRAGSSPPRASSSPPRAIVRAVGTPALDQ